MAQDNPEHPSAYSHSLVSIGAHKLFPTLVFGLGFLLVMFMAFMVWLEPTHDELHREELLDWCSHWHPDLNFEACVDLVRL